MRFDFHFSVELTYTLSNSPDPNAGGVGPNFQQALGRYALSVILYLYSNRFSFASYSDKSGLAARVSVDICQAFLHQSEDRKLHVAWQPAKIGGNVERDRYLAALR